MNLTTSYVVNGDDLPVNNINDLLPVHDDSICLSMTIPSTAMGQASLLGVRYWLSRERFC